MKLSKVQTMVIEHMRNGWELGISNGLNSYAWLQEGKLSCGGKTLPVSIATVFALKKLKLVDWVYTFPTSKVYLLIKE